VGTFRHRLLLAAACFALGCQSEVLDALATRAAAAAAEAGADEAGPPTDHASCVGLASLCQGESCCVSYPVPGGTLPMGRGTEDCSAMGCQTGAGLEGCPVGITTCLADQQPEHPVMVASFVLDKYEVTVGRFRRFLAAYDAWRSQANPAPSAGANPAIAGSGWQAGWNVELPANAAAFLDAAHLEGGTEQAWTDSAGANESAAVNFVSWYEAFAFCIWDGGRLPTEAEWEYAAVGGAENRLYPWGNTMPDHTRANYEGTSQGIPVGSSPAGVARFGHLDMAGGVWEWVLDTYQVDYTGAGSTNPATLPTGTVRILRGGGWLSTIDYLLSTFRHHIDSGHYHASGWRCAR
jgi:formylglycine-generating enzyme